MKALWSLAIVASVVVVASAQRAVPGGAPFGGPANVLMAGANPPVTGAPFSAVAMTEWQGTLPSGQEITRQRHVAIYRDSVGRVRTELRSESSSSSGPMFVAISDPVARYAYQLNVTKRIGLRMPLDIADASRASGNPGSRLQTHAPNAPTVQTTDLGMQTISGVSAVGTRTTITFAAGVFGNQQSSEFVREEWVFPPLHLAVLTRWPDPEGGYTVTRLTDIVRAERIRCSFRFQLAMSSGFGRASRGRGSRHLASAIDRAHAAEFGRRPSFHCSCAVEYVSP